MGIFSQSHERCQQATSWINKTLRWLISSAYVVPILWVAIGIFPPYLKFPDQSNNFFIFYHSFHHLLHQSNLHAAHPELHNDHFLYGPLFAVLMAPISLLPPAVGALLFLAASTLFFLLAVHLLPIPVPAKNLILVICMNAFLGNQQNFQTNAFTAALILITFGSLLSGRYFVASICLSVGVLTKLYAGIGVFFFAFAAKRPRAGLMFFLVLFLLFLLPVVFSSFDFLLNSYLSWFDVLQMKSASVLQAGKGTFQGQSLPGFLQRAVKIPEEILRILSGVGLVLFFLPWLNILAWNIRQFQFLGLASAMMFVVLFSPGSENPTYIILQTGVAVWFVVGSRLSLRWRLPLLLVFFFFSSLVFSDLYPEVVKSFFRDYSLRAVPGTILWFVVLWEMASCGWGNRVPDNTSNEKGILTCNNPPRPR